MQHIVVDTAQQKLFFLSAGLLLAEYSISTAKNGLGEKKGSECTPRGWHIVCELLGQDMPVNTCFKGRVSVGLWRQDSNIDPILTRIIRLLGQESGFNLGGDHDTFQRHVYIHGTCDEYPMGIPLSHGCIRMRNQDIIDLCLRINLNTTVYIH